MANEISSIIVVTNPIVSVLHPEYSTDWTEPEQEADDTIAALFEDLPVAEPRDYVEEEVGEDHADCQCDECTGNYYDERDDYEDDYDDDYGRGGLDWNESGYFD